MNIAKLILILKPLNLKILLETYSKKTSFEGIYITDTKHLFLGKKALCGYTFIIFLSFYHILK